MPAGNYCSVAICKSQSSKAKEMGEYLRFFHLPKDPVLKKQWMIKCYRKDAMNPDSARVCSKHFTLDDYEDALQARLMNVPPKKLKKTAVPSLLLHPWKSMEPRSSRTPKYIQEKQERERKELVEKLLNSADTDDNETFAFQTQCTSRSKRKKADPSTEESDDMDIDDPFPISETPPSAEILSDIEEDGSTNVDESLPDADSISTLIEGMENDEKVKILEAGRKELLQVNRNLVRRLRAFENKTSSLEHQNAILKNENTALRNEISKKFDFETEAKRLFKDCLTSNQIEIMLKKKSTARWTMEESTKALILYKLSRRSYNYITKTLNYPFPGSSTIRRWTRNQKLKKMMEPKVSILVANHFDTNFPNETDQDYTSGSDEGESDANQRIVKNHNQAQVQHPEQELVRDAAEAIQTLVRQKNQQHIVEISQEQAVDAASRHENEALQEYTFEIPQQFVLQVNSDNIAQTDQEHDIDAFQEDLTEDAQEHVVESAQEHAVETAQEHVVETEQEQVIDTTHEQAIETSEEQAIETSEEQAIETIQDHVIEPTEEHVIEAAHEHIIENVPEHVIDAIQGHVMESDQEYIIITGQDHVIEVGQEQVIETDQEHLIQITQENINSTSDSEETGESILRNILLFQGQLLNPLSPNKTHMS